MERLSRNSYPGILCGIIILILTGLPGSCLPHVKPIIGLDKVAHLIMYACFAFICLWGYREQYANNGKTYRTKAIVTATVVSVAYGGLTELMQEHLVPSRIGDWRDFVADTIGTIIGVFIFAIFYRHKK